MLHKSLGESIKDVDALQGIITGYAAAFNIIDDDQDIIIPGAFQKTLTEQGPQSKQPRIKFLYQHDATKLLGVPSVLKEDSYGLYFEVRLADTPLARDVAILYYEGILTEHSIGYEVVDSAWDRTKNARLLKQLKLYEFSVVTWGACSQTPVISIKSFTKPETLTAMADRAAKIDSLLHNGNLHSDALCHTLDRELKALHAALAPANAGSQPYTIQGVTASMNQLAKRLAAKSAATPEPDDESLVALRDAEPPVTPPAAKDAQHAQVRKARDFDTLFQSLAEGDQLQDEWGDTFIAFTRAMSELMWMASSARNGWLPADAADGFDLMAAAQANMDAFSAKVMDLVTRSDAADFTPQLDYDGDQFLDPDGCNAMEDSDWDYDSRDMRGVGHKHNPLAMPPAPAPLRKAGRAISSPNRDTITKALDGMTEAMKSMQTHHAAIADLMEKTDPDAVRQDEDNVLGDDDTENGGTNPNKSRTHAPDRPQAGTTHQAQPFAAIFADADALTSRFAGGKAH